MSKARTLANLISDNAELADGQISVAEVVGAAPTASPTFTGNIDAGDNVKIRLGDSDDLQIWHDGSNSYIRDSGTGDLQIRASNLLLTDVDGTIMLDGRDNGAVSLYHNGSQKISTTSTGIDVTGTAVTDGLTVAGNVSVDGGTIKLDGNYPVGTDNVALGNTALDATASGSAYNTAIGANSLSADTLGSRSTALGFNALAVQNFTSATNAYNVAVGHNASVSMSTGTNNTALGSLALQSNTTASDNTAVGYQAGYSNTTGASNVALGAFALDATTTASNNTAVGTSSLGSNTTGSENTAIGRVALIANTTGANNVAIGKDAFKSNTTASNNTAVGYQAGYSNTTGDTATAIGSKALRANTTGRFNSALGYESLYSNSTGTYNVAVGSAALTSNTTGIDNTAVGYQAGYSNTTSSYSTYLGDHAGYSTTSTRNTFLGHASGESITTGERNTILGRFSGNVGGLDIRTSSNNVVLSDGDGNPRLRISSIGSMGFNYPELPSTLSTDTGSPLYVFRPSGNANATANYLNFGGTNRNANGLSKMLTFNHGYWGAGREVAAIGVETISSAGGSGHGYGDLVFYTGESGNGDAGSTSQERVRINSSGNFYIGTTTSGWEAATGTGYIAASGYWKSTTSTSSQNAHFYFGNSNGWVGQIYTSGSSTTYQTSSDHRLKENVEYTWDATTRLKQLKPARFNFIADADTTVDGFLAHEAQAVVPESVSGIHNEVEVWKDGDELPDGVSIGDNKLDDDGNTIPVMQGIDQSKLVPLLVKTIQELEARITALEGA